MAQYEAYSTLMRGIQELNFENESVPSKLRLNGHHAFPLAVNSQDQVIIAASSYGKGRIVVMGHEVYLKKFPDLVKNALDWLQPSPNRAKVGVHSSCKDVMENLSSPIEAEVCELRDDLGVYITKAYHVGPFAKELVNFLKEGGGILIAGQAWHWSHTNPDEDVQLNFPGNRVTGVSGIYFTKQYGKRERVPISSTKMPFKWSSVALEETYSTLTRGIKELTFKGPPVPSELLLNGHHAFPLALSTQDQVIIAASCYGLGRIVVMGHETYLQEFPDLVKNALGWLQPSPDRAKVGVHSSCKDLMENLSPSTQVEVCQFSSDLGVYITDAYSVGSCAKELVSFLKEGGGIIIAGQAWEWHQLNPNENGLLNFTGNSVSSVAGIYFTEHQGSHGQTTVPPTLPLKWSSKSVKEYLKADIEVLLDGVSEFDIRGNNKPSEVSIHGPLSFPIGVTPDGRAFLAGAHYGLGRIILATNQNYVNHKPFTRFLMNAVLWLDKGRRGLVGVSTSQRVAADLLSKSGLKCEVTDLKDGLSVYVCTADEGDMDMGKDILSFVAEGGGLLIGGWVWPWASKNNKYEAPAKHPCNHLLNQMGLSLLPYTLNKGVYNAQSGRELLEVYQFPQFFADHMTQTPNISEDQRGHLEKMKKDLYDYLSMSAHHTASYSSVLKIGSDLIKSGKVPQVCDSCPVKKAEDRLLLEVSSTVCKVSPDLDELLPYIIKDLPDLPTVSKVKLCISASADAQQWISTGLYLPPGMRTDIKIPTEIVGKGWQVMIGCQSDDIRKLKVLRRAPVVCERFLVVGNIMQVWNLWGGLIYLITPRNFHVEGLEIEVQNAVQAPYYKSGETSVEDWVKTVRHYPAPWAELEFENLVVSLNSKFIRDLEQPDLVAALWDEVMAAAADLAAKPYARKERFVVDVQISVGYLHAGYPIMMHNSSAADVLKTKKLWGLLHELGHNQQMPVWEFSPHTTEATCNLWSVYISETVLKVKREIAGRSLHPDKRLKRIQKYVENGRDLKHWNVWVALETYLQLQEEFGWDPFKKVFAAYHHMDGVPRDNKGKMNLYAETFSKVVKKNLTSFFKAWGWPIEAATEEKLSGLPDWSDHPMAQYV